MREPAPSWKRFLTFSNIVATVSTAALLLGNIQSISDFFGTHIGLPEIKTPDTREPISFLMGDPLKFDAPAQNTRTVGVCSVEYQTAEEKPSGGLELDPLPKEPDPLKSGEQKSLSVTGKTLQAGDFVVTIKGRATSGLFGRTKPFESHHHVRVWAPYAFKLRETKLRDANTGAAEFCGADFELLTGNALPEGLDVRASIPDASGAKFLGVTANVVKEGGKAAENGTLIDWQTHQLNRFGRVEFTVYLASVKVLSKEEWKAAVKQININAGPPRRPFAPSVQSIPDRKSNEE